MEEGKEMIVRCPNCGFKFDITYARAFACKTCPVLSYSPSCNYVKCPRCGHEFPLR